MADRVGSFRNTSHLIGIVALVGRLAQEQVAAALTPLGITYAQAVTLVRLWRRDGHSMLQRELIESLGVSRASGSEVLNQLERLELVERSWDAADARNRVVRLTSAGRDLEPAVLHVFDTVEASLREDGAGNQTDSVFGALRAMLDNAREARRGDPMRGTP